METGNPAPLSLEPSSLGLDHAINHLNINKDCKKCQLICAVIAVRAEYFAPFSVLKYQNKKRDHYIYDVRVERVLFHKFNI